MEIAVAIIAFAIIYAILLSSFEDEGTELVSESLYTPMKKECVAVGALWFVPDLSSYDEEIERAKRVEQLRNAYRDWIDNCNRNNAEYEERWRERAIATS